MRTFILTILLFFLNVSSSQAQEWIKGHTNKDGFRLQLAFFSNASNETGDTTRASFVGGFEHAPPLIIHSTAKYTGAPSFLQCSSSSFLVVGKGCYTCPADFDMNTLVDPDDQRKCVKFYDPVDSFSGIYDRDLVEAAGFTPRQIKCIFDVGECYIGMIGAVGGERYGVACGGNYGGPQTDLIDNVDKCCQAHDLGKWKNNHTNQSMDTQGRANCANDLNLLRCVNKVLADEEIYFTEQGEYAAQWLKDALNAPTGGLCQSDWDTNDGGAYPWSDEECISGNCYTHIFETREWHNDPSINVTWERADTPVTAAANATSTSTQAMRVSSGKAIIGVGMNNDLWTREHLTSAWQHVSNSGSVRSVAVIKDGTILGVGMDNDLWTRASLSSPWQNVPNSGSVRSVAVMENGTILGVGMDNDLWSRATLSSPWQNVPNSGSVRSVTVMQDGTILGVGMDNDLWTRASLSSPWQNVPNSGSVISVSGSF